MTPLPEHEYFKEVMGDAVKDIADELALDYESYGSATWRDRNFFGSWTDATARYLE